MSSKRVLVVYYSFSSQTSKLVQNISEGLEEAGLEVFRHRLEPSERMDLPFTSTLTMVKAMITSFFRSRVKVSSPTYSTDGDYDAVILAGPTWSFFPSGPVLYYLDAFATPVISGRVVYPLISCRTYWRMHYNCLKELIENAGGTIGDPLVFKHSGSEPWKTIGLCLKMLGKLPRNDGSWFRKKYPRYGHSPEQFALARKAGAELGRKIAGQ